MGRALVGKDADGNIGLRLSFLLNFAESVASTTIPRAYRKMQDSSSKQASGDRGCKLVSRSCQWLHKFAVKRARYVGGSTGVIISPTMPRVSTFQHDTIRSLPHSILLRRACSATGVAADWLRRRVPHTVFATCQAALRFHSAPKAAHSGGPPPCRLCLAAYARPLERHDVRSRSVACDGARALLRPFGR